MDNASGPDQDPGLMENISSRMDDRRQDAMEIFQANGNEEQSVLETGLQLAGKVGVGGFLDIVGELASSGFDVAQDVVEAIPGSGEITEPLSMAWDAVKDSSLAQAGMEAAANGVKQYGEWAETNPRAARNLEAVTNIATVLMPVKAKKKLGPEDINTVAPTELSKLSTKLNNASKSQRVAQKEAFVEKLVIPKETKHNVGKKITGSDMQGKLKKEVYTPTKREADMIEVVRFIDDVGPEKTMRQNYRAVDKEISVAAKKLEADVTRLHPGSVPRRSVQARVASAYDELASSNLMVGDAQASARKMVAEMQEILAKHPSTPAGILKARKAFDQHLLKQSGGAKTLGSDLETARSVAAKKLRNVLNEVVDEAVPGANVRKSLNDQSLMFEALDNMQEVALKEKLNVISRSWDRIRSLVPARNEALQTSAVVMGSTAIGIVGVMAPVMAGAAVAAGLTYVGGKFIMSPAMKKGLSGLVRGLDKSIKISTNPQMLKELRADRAAILEMLKNSQVEKEQSTQPSR